MFLENSLNIIIFSNLIQNLYFSIQANEILLIVRLDENSKAFSELLAVIDTGQLMNMSNL